MPVIGELSTAPQSGESGYTLASPDDSFAAAPGTLRLLSAECADVLSDVKLEPCDVPADR
jgi:hypothetical protein